MKRTDLPNIDHYEKEDMQDIQCGDITSLTWVDCIIIDTVVDNMLASDDTNGAVTRTNYNKSLNL